MKLEPRRIFLPAILSLLFLAATPTPAAPDDEILENLDFFSQMEVIENDELAAELTAIPSATEVHVPGSTKGVSREN